MTKLEYTLSLKPNKFDVNTNPILVTKNAH